MEDSFFMFDNQALHYNYYTTDNNNAIIILVHGLGEHFGRYEPWAKRWNAFNYAVCGFDLPGHGLSYGKRGHFPPLEVVFDMLEKFIEKVKADFPNKPYILYGHSMGGNIVANYVIERNPKLNACILTSPWLELPSDPPFFQFLLAKIMYKIYPAYGDKTGLNETKISRIPEEVEKYKNDPLVHENITPGLFLPLFYKGLKAIKNAKKISLPTYLIHGTADELTSPKGSIKFQQNNPDITIKLYEGAYHELHNDLDSQQVLEDMLDWIAAKVLYRP